MSKPSAAKRARQARRRDVGTARAARRARRSVANVAAAVLATRLLEALVRWQGLPPGEQFRESCPLCGALVLVTNKQGAESDVSHAMPVCDLWLAGLEAIGGHSPRVEHHQG